jgi:hypothetical protein
MQLSTYFYEYKKCLTFHVDLWGTHAGGKMLLKEVENKGNFLKFIFFYLNITLLNCATGNKNSHGPKFVSSYRNIIQTVLDEKYIILLRIIQSVFVLPTPVCWLLPTSYPSYL